jgi:hypothetical protein
MAFDPSTAIEAPVEQKRKFDPSTVTSDTPEQKTKNEPTLIERGKQVAKEAGAGAVGGFFAPELMETAGVGAQALGRGLSGAPGIGGFIGRASTGLGTGLLTGAEVLRASRLGRTASTMGGAVSGAGGETLGQAYESQYGPGVGAETARLLGSIVVPMPFEYLGTAGGKLLGTALGAVGVPGMNKAKVLGEFLKERGISARDVENLSEAKKKLLDEKVKSLRFGDERSKIAETDIINLFKGEAGRITSTAEQQAFQFEQQAKQIVDEAERAGGVVTQEMEKRIASLRSQFDTAAEKIRSDATAQARETVTAASKRAEVIRKNSSNQSASVQQIADTEAKAVIKEAQQKADQLLKSSERQIAESKQRIEGQQKRLSKFERSAKTSQQQQIGQIGERILPTELGQQTRKVFDDALTKITTDRETATEPLRNAWKNSITKKEAAGQNYRSTRAYQEAFDFYNSLLQNKELKLLMQTDEKVKSAISNVLQTINPQKNVLTSDGQMAKTSVNASADALETVYRRLKDRASGLPAEGVEAIDQQLAGKLAKPIEKIIDEFSEGSYSAFKNAWRDASKPLNEFRTKAGRYVTDKPEGFDLGDYLERLSGVGSQVFGNASSAKQLVSVAGKDEANRLARGYLADQIGEATPAKIKSVLDKNRDWLNLAEFKTLRDQLDSISTGVAKAKSQEERSQILQKALGVRVERLPTLPAKEAARIESSGLTEAQRIQRDAQRKLQDIEKQKGAKLERFGEPSTEKLRTEAERQISASAPVVESQVGEMRRTAEQQAKDLATAAGKEAKPLTEAATKTRQAAQERVNTLLANTTDESRFEQILLGAKQDEWALMGEIINANPQAKSNFAKAVGQVVARKAEGSLKGARDSMESLGERLINFGLMDKQSVDALKAQLNDIYLMPITTEQKTSFIASTIRKALSGYGYPAAERLGEFTAGAVTPSNQGKQ